MTDMTIGIILSCKQYYTYKTTTIDSIKGFLANYCLEPDAHYNDYVFNKVIIQAFEDYISSCDNPRSVIKEFFDIKYNACSYTVDDSSAIIALFKTIQIKRFDKTNNRYQYVNGFHDFSFHNLELSL